MTKYRTRIVKLPKGRKVPIWRSGAGYISHRLTKVQMKARLAGGTYVEADYVAAGYVE